MVKTTTPKVIPGAFYFPEAQPTIFVLLHPQQTIYHLRTQTMHYHMAAV